jgi:PAS domain S-box-containing protein
MNTPARKRPIRRQDGDALRRENHRLRARLTDAEQTLDAIRRGAVDAVVVSGPEGERVYTLQGADSSYRTMVETMHAGAATLDLEGVVVYANVRMAEMLRKPLEQVMGVPLAHFVSPEDLEEFHRLLRKAAGKGAAGEVRLRAASGELVPVHLALGLLDSPDLQALCVVATDLTERKRIEEALRRVPGLLERRIEERTAELQRALASLEQEAVARRTLSTFPEQNPHPVLRVNPDGWLLYANAASGPLLKHWECGTGDRLPEALRHEVLQSLTLGATQELELVCGSSIYSLICAPHRVQGYVNIYGRDITKRKQIEAQQERLVKDLESVNQELRQFAYVVSHDLKAPLRAISSLAGWLRKDYADKLGGEAAEHLLLLEGRARRLNTLIDGVLEYSRLGRNAEPRVPVDLRAAVGEVLDLLGWPPAVRIHLGPLPTVMAIRMPLQQILLNLLQNAIKFNDKPQPEVRIACEPVPGYWQVSVADNGPGIAERHFDKIFLMFRTLAPRDKVESTGIGLALAKKAVELQGGRIWVTSREMEGATFWFTLPREESSERKSP